MVNLLEKPREALTSNQAHYSSVLCELWNSYTKFLHVGMAAAGFTIVAIAQYLNVVSASLDQTAFFVKASVLLAGGAGVSFGFCRWLCQIIMERQAYGPRTLAESYFLDTETRLPNALRYSAGTINFFYKLNDLFKFLGSFSLVLSWTAIVYVLFKQVDLSLAPTVR
jgi:hypothetical protein